MNELLKLLEPHDLGGDRFQMAPSTDGWRGLYGGQVIAQALAAAGRTVPPERAVHSLHATFLRPGKFDKTLDLQVHRDLDGGSFSNRRIVVEQQGEVILSALASFHRKEDGVHHGATMPTDVVPPEELRDFRDELSPKHRGERGRGPLRHVEMRVADGPRPGDHHPGPPEATVWLRCAAAQDAPDAIHRTLLAYASDAFLITTAMRPHRGNFSLGSRVASLDHTIWFHEQPRLDDWLLFALHSPWAGHARGLTFAYVFARDGRHVATVAQEGLMRVVARDASDSEKMPFG